jgi:predicted ABC-type sugar transport system permease subunit
VTVTQTDEVARETRDSRRGLAGSTSPIRVQEHRRAGRDSRAHCVRPFYLRLRGQHRSFPAVRIDTARIFTAQATQGGSALTFTVLAGVVVGSTSILGGEG